MSADEPFSLPPALQKRLQEESTSERADLEALWERIGRLRRDEAVPDADAAWQSLQERLEDRPSPRDAGVSVNHAPDRAAADRAARSAKNAGGSTGSTSHRWAGPWTVAAALVVLAVAGVWAWSLPTTVTAPSGDHRTATLPDGSSVQLNSGTSISHARNFQAWPLVSADTRTVRLDGEAYFTVEDAPRPFVVETASARIQVIGTEFNVRAHRRSGPGTQVTVSSGRVRVAAIRNADTSVVLDTPGQTSTVADASVPPSRPEATDLKRTLVWRDGGFAVTDLPLTDVVSELERRYDVEIRIDGSVENASAPLSLYYPVAPDVETIVGDLCTARGLKYRPTSRGLVIYDP